MAQEMTRDDLDRHIGAEVEKGLEKSMAKMEDRLIGVMRDILGDNAADQAKESRERANDQWEKSTSKERNEAVRSALQGKPVKPKRNWREKVLGDNKTGNRFAAFAALYLRTGGDLNKAARIAQESGAVEMLGAINRTLEAGDLAGGGAFIPEEFSSDFIEYLYDQSAFRQAGPLTEDLSATGNLTIPKLTGSTTVYWIGESEGITESEPTTGQVKLEPKKLGGLVPLSGDLIKYASGFASQIVENDLLMALALGEDLAILRGDGTANQPKGILNLTASGNKFATSGTSHANKVQDLIKAEYKIDAANVAYVRRALFMHSRARAGLMLTLTADGAFAFLPEISMNGSVMGKPIYLSNQIPVNLDTSSTGDNDETDVTMVEMTQCVLGETGQVELARTNAHGSNFANDIEHVRGIHRVGFVMRHDQAAGIIRQCTWGAALDT